MYIVLDEWKHVNVFQFWPVLHRWPNTFVFILYSFSRKRISRCAWMVRFTSSRGVEQDFRLVRSMKLKSQETLLLQASWFESPTKLDSFRSDRCAVTCMKYCSLKVVFGFVKRWDFSMWNRWPNINAGERDINENNDFDLYDCKCVSLNSVKCQISNALCFKNKHEAAVYCDDRFRHDLVKELIDVWNWWSS